MQAGVNQRATATTEFWKSQKCRIRLMVVLPGVSETNFRDKLKYHTSCSEFGTIPKEAGGECGGVYTETIPPPCRIMTKTQIAMWFVSSQFFSQMFVELTFIHYYILLQGTWAYFSMNIHANYWGSPLVLLITGISLCSYILSSYGTDPSKFTAKDLASKPQNSQSSSQATNSQSSSQTMDSQLDSESMDAGFTFA